EAGQAKVDLARAYALFEQTLRDMRQVTVLSYTPQAEALYQHWRQQRLRLPTHDLRIAAICVAHAATLISRNRQDFVQVPGLQDGCTATHMQIPDSPGLSGKISDR